MFTKCTLPKYDLPIKTSTDRLINIASYGIYATIKTHQSIEKFNKELDEFTKCVLSENIRKINSSGNLENAK